MYNSIQKIPQAQNHTNKNYFCIKNQICPVTKKLPFGKFYKKKYLTTYKFEILCPELH